MTKDALIQDILQEITYSGQMPFSLNPTEIGRVVYNAEKYFYDNWQYAVEKRYLILPIGIFNAPQFKAQRTIIMPECVAFVDDVKETGSAGSVFGTVDPDFSDTKFIGSELTMNPFMGDNLMYRVVMMAFLDLTRALVRSDISYKYNKNSRALFIAGQAPRTDAICIIKKKLDAEFLYEDEIFQRYVRAKAKLRMGEMVTNFDIPLIGDVKIVYNNFMTRAQAEFDKVVEDMSKENTPNFMIITNF